VLLEAAKHSQQPAAKPTIMVVDDDNSALMLMELMLSRAGFDVALCIDADDALDRLNTIEPDAYILDVNMPGTDGVLLCRMLRAREGSATKPILLLSARKEPGIVESGLAAGADDYIVKPVMNLDLIQRIRDLLAVR
jgi:DNA-binding response OmpR family regulator